MEEKIKNLFHQGFKLREIAEMTGLADKKVEYLVYEKLNLPRRRQETKEVNQERILFLKKWGYEPEEISEGEGIRLKTVRRVWSMN